jgi:hypothetical protein
VTTRRTGRSAFHLGARRAASSARRSDWRRGASSPRCVAESLLDCRAVVERRRYPLGRGVRPLAPRGGSRDRDAQSLSRAAHPRRVHGDARPEAEPRSGPAVVRSRHDRMRGTAPYAE